jgi:hypothetical protein
MMMSKSTLTAFTALTALLMLTLAAPAAVAQPDSIPLREAARVAALRQSLTPATTQQSRSWVARHPVLTGALAGASVGASVGALTCPSPIAEGGDSCDYYTHSADARGVGALYYGAWGAGIGALVGLVVHAVTR